MALSSGAEIFDFAADDTDVITFTTDLVDGGIDGGDAVWSNTDKAPMGKAVLHLPDGCTGGTWNSVPMVHLWGTKQDIDGTNDETPEPSSSDTVGAHKLGSFVLDDHATPGTEQRRSLLFSAEGLGWKCWIENDTGRTLDYVSTAITVEVEGVSVLQKA